MKKTMMAIIGLLIFFIFPLALRFTQNEIILGFVVLAVAALTIVLASEKREWLLFAIGVVIGFCFELFGDMIFKMQFWSQGMLFGIPLWVPLLWGYGFVMIRRIGNLIVEDKK